MTSQEPWGIVDYVDALWRYKGQAVLCVLLAVGGGFAWLQYTPQKFESEAKLFVRVGRENAALDPTLTKGETLIPSLSREEEMNSIVEHLRSRVILERVLAAVEPATADLSAEDRERALDRLRGDVYISAPRTTTVVTVRARALSPEQAQKIVASVIDIYRDEHMRMSRSTGSFDFFKEQTVDLERQLTAAQAELRDYKDRAQMASIEGRRAALESQISAAQTQIQQVDASLSAAEAKVKTLKATVDTLPASVLQQMMGGTPSDGLAAMRERFFQLQVHQEEVRSKYARPHPVAQAVGEQVQEVSETLKREEPERQRLVAAITAQDIAHQAALLAERKTLGGQLEELQKNLAQLNAAEFEINRLARTVKQLESKYLTYSENMEEARMDRALQAGKITNLSVIQPPALMPLAVQPKKAMTLAAAGFGGMLLGGIIAFLSEQLRRSALLRDERVEAFRVESRSISVPSEKLKAARGMSTMGLEKRTADF